MNNNRMLIIGAGGQLGTDMCTLSRDAGYEIIATDFPAVDIADRDSVDRVVASAQAGTIVNCAAFTAVDDCESKRDIAYAINADGPGFIAEAAQKYGARFIHISTDYVFDGEKPEPYFESDSPNPRSVYGLSKLLGEKNCAEQCENHQIFRIAWLYGVHGKNFVKTIRAAAEKKAAAGEILTVVDDQVGTPTYTREVCRQILAAQKSTEKGVFHCTAEGECSWYGFTRAIVAAAGIPVNLQPCKTGDFPRPAPRPKNSRLKNSRLKQAGIATMVGWEDAYREFLADEASAQLV